MIAEPKIGVLIEAHFDETEYNRFNEYFPQRGYHVEYLSHLWGQPSLTFAGNDHSAEVEVSVEVNDVDPRDYTAIFLIGGYAMDRLRYEQNPRPHSPNRAPAVEFLRKAVAAMDDGGPIVGAICHGLWLFCAAPELLRGRRVTCAHNILCDVVNAGGVPAFEGDRLAVSCIDGGLVTGQHPGVIEEYMPVLLEQMQQRHAKTK